MARVRRVTVATRAQNRCEYCQLDQQFSTLPHQIDHIRATKHSGADTLSNTCYSCASCNLAKGPNVAGYDPVTDELVALFNPRIDRWSDHFEWDFETLTGITSVGRATINVLRINDPMRLEHRKALIEAGGISAELIHSNMMPL